MTAPAILVTDYNLANQVSGGILVGKSFAYLPADLLDRPALRWIKSLVPAAATKARVVSLLGPEPLELPGMKLAARDRPALSAAVVTSDKPLYREGADVVNLLVCDPFGRGREAELDIELSGQSFGRRPVTLSASGAGAISLRDLPCGDYKIRVRGAPSSDPACTFTVAEYRLSPLVAALERQRAEGDRVTLDIALSAFGVPASGDVRVELFDAGKRLEHVVAPARDGKLSVTFALRGDGPHTVNFQLASDPGRTATIPLVGSRAAERSDTVFSTLGVEVVGSLLPAEDARDVRGIYLRRGGTSTSPVRLDRVDARKPKLTAMTDLDSLVIAIIDPTLAKQAGAVDPATAPHPAHDDERYRHGEQLFLDGKHADALETFAGARTAVQRPHPNYAYFIACCHAKLGDRGKALAALRTAIREGWVDVAHMRTDADLAALRDEPDFALLCNGGVGVVEAPLKRGESITLDVPAPLAYLALGAFVDGAPWEGNAAIVVPAAAGVELDVPATAVPGGDITIGIRAAADVYVIVKDARLLSADTPASRLAGQLKSHVDAMRSKVLGTGAPTDTLTSLMPRMPTALTGGYAMPPSMPGAMPFPSAPVAGIPMSRPAPGAVVMRSAMTMGDIPPPQAMAMPMPAMPVEYEGSFGALGDSEDEDLAVGDEPAAETRAAIEDAPEVVFAGLVTARDGHASLTIALGDAFADYVVEAFALDGAEWATASGRFRAERTVFAAFDVPAFVHRDDAAIGRIVVGSGGSGMTVEVTRDGAPVAITADGNPLARGASIPARRADIVFVAEPGDYAVRLVDAASGEVIDARARVDEPGKLRRIARSVRFLRPGERISRRDDASIISLRALPGLDKPFSVLCDATADYGHACCEQTAAKLFAAASMYMFAGDSKKRRDRAEEIVIAGVRRERSMFLPGRGFKMYPDSSATPNDYYGPMTARYLWNLDLLRSGSTSRALAGSIDDGLEMARDSTRAYKLEWPPRTASTPVDAYGAIRFGQDRKLVDQAVGTLRSFATESTGGRSTRGAVGFRADAAYAAAGLFRAGGDAAFPIALQLANTVVGDLGTEGRLYSTVDSVAAIALMTEIQAAGVVGRGARAIVDGRSVAIADAPSDAAEIAAPSSAGGTGTDATVAVEVTRIVEDDWDAFTAKLPVTVTTLAKGRSTARVAVGDPVDLQIRLDGGYKVGDLVWVALPDALSRVIGGGQVKRFSIDFAGATEVVIPLAATALTVDRSGEEAPQHFAVCVRNMFEEERAGNPGPLDITVAAPKGGDGLLSRAASALRRLMS